MILIEKLLTLFYPPLRFDGYEVPFSRMVDVGDGMVVEEIEAWD